MKWTHETADRFGRARLEERLCELTQPWDSHSLMQRLGRCGRQSVLSASSVVTSTVLARPSLLFTANNHSVSRPLGPSSARRLGDDIVARDSCSFFFFFFCPYWVNNIFPPQVAHGGVGQESPDTLRSAAKTRHVKTAILS